MRSSPALLVFLLVLWVVACILWYGCRIQGNCLFTSGGKPAQTLLVDLEGAENQTFYLRQRGDGILEFLPGSDNSGLSGLKQYLYDHPDQDLNIITANEGQANGLLAMLVISGVPNNRLNVFTDPTLGSKERPITIASSPNEWYVPPVDSAALRADSLIRVTDTLKKTEERPEQVVVRWEPNIPCPTVSDNSPRPEIGDILYPSGGFSVRCTDHLAAFTKRAQSYLKENPNSGLVITGHTDDNQNKTNNYQLALKRAVEVKKFFIKQGIPGHRIETYSRGGDEPVADNDTREGKQANRRVAIQWK